jgi:hypothetical protein
MKTLLTITTLVFTLMFSSPSFSDWTKVDEDVKGNAFYVDFERIRKVDGYVYYWDLSDYLKPIKYGILSAKVYRKVDCKLFQFKDLIFSFHKEPMGRGSQESDYDYSPKTPEWRYPSPNSSGESILKSVCSL